MGGYGRRADSKCRGWRRTPSAIIARYRYSGSATQAGGFSDDPGVTSPESFLWRCFRPKFVIANARPSESGTNNAGQYSHWEPSHLLKSLEDIADESTEIVGNHNNRQTFDRVLEDGLALRRLVDAGQER